MLLPFAVRWRQHPHRVVCMCRDLCACAHADGFLLVTIVNMEHNIAVGVRTDCEAFIAAYKETNSLRYEDFATLWKTKNMSFIFCGRGDDRELNAFVEASLAIAKNLWLSSRSDNQMKMGGFYLVYAFYMKQPTKSPLRIRLTQSDWDSCTSFVNYVIQNEHTDALYIYRTLLRSHAFDFVYLSYEINPKIDSCAQEDVDIDKAFKFEDRLLNYTQDSSFKQFQAFHERYHEMKGEVAKQYFSDQQNSLSISDSNLLQQISNLTNEYSNRMRGDLTDQASAEPAGISQQAKSDEERVTRLSKLKKAQFLKKVENKGFEPHKNKSQSPVKRSLEDVVEEGGPSTKKVKERKQFIWHKTVIKGSDSESSSDD